MRNHNVQVYFGDLNFRIDMQRTAILEAIQRKDLRSLLGKDELYMNGMQHSVLQHCQEGQIQFPPTYKYDAGTNNYDT